MDTDPGIQKKVDIAVDNLLDIHLVWANRVGDTSKMTYKRRYQGNWENDITLSILNIHDYECDIEIDALNNLHVVAAVLSPGPQHILYKKILGDD